MWWGRWLLNGGYRIAVGVEVGLAARLGKRRELRNRGHQALRLHGHAAVRHSLQNLAIQDSSHGVLIHSWQEDQIEDVDLEAEGQLRARCLRSYVGRNQNLLDLKGCLAHKKHPPRRTHLQPYA